MFSQFRRHVFRQNVIFSQLVLNRILVTLLFTFTINDFVTPLKKEGNASSVSALARIFVNCWSNRVFVWFGIKTEFVVHQWSKHKFKGFTGVWKECCELVYETMWQTGRKISVCSEIYSSCHEIVSFCEGVKIKAANRAALSKTFIETC